jgi:hypothetical protein
MAEIVMIIVVIFLMMKCRYHIIFIGKEEIQGDAEWGPT